MSGFSLRHVQAESASTENQDSLLQDKILNEVGLCYNKSRESSESKKSNNVGK